MHEKCTIEINDKKKLRGSNLNSTAQKKENSTNTHKADGEGGRTSSISMVAFVSPFVYQSKFYAFQMQM